jgi:exodeoxyribonuclease V alpha subunit
MKPRPQPCTQEVLAGLIERVTYHTSENGFCVLRVKARGHRDVVTVVGHAAAIAAGEWITASGEWVNDRTHGQQFRARFLRTSPPTSADGIEKYLSSGMIRGVGPVYAKKLVRAFGEKVFDVIESTPERLREVDGIGPVRAASILAAWAEQKAVREIMVFLHSNGVGTARAVRIFKTYGADAIQVMTENPVRSKNRNCRKEVSFHSRRGLGGSRWGRMFWEIDRESAGVENEWIGRAFWPTSRGRWTRSCWRGSNIWPPKIGS